MNVQRQKTKLALQDKPRSLCVCTIVPGLPAGISHPTLGTLMGLRDLYAKMGTRFNHACAMRRVLEFAAPDVPWGDVEGDEGT